MVILCVSSSRLTTSLVKLHANMARTLPTRPTRRGIHSKNTKRTLLCVSSHLERLRGAEMLMGHPLMCRTPHLGPRTDRMWISSRVRRHTPYVPIPLRVASFSLAALQILPRYHSMNTALTPVHFKGGRLSKSVNAD